MTDPRKQDDPAATLVERLRELDAKATPGPWGTGSRCEENYIYGNVQPDGSGEHLACISSTTDDGRGGDTFVLSEGSESAANAALIVALRNALPDLIEHLSRREQPAGDVVERVARAIAKTVGCGWDEFPLAQDSLKCQARAAIAAIAALQPNSDKLCRETIEACAKVCDERAALAMELSPLDLQQANTAAQLAARIRALTEGETP